MVSVETLVFARSLLRLKSDPSYLYLMPMPASESLKAPDSIAENIRLNRLGASTLRWRLGMMLRSLRCTSVTTQ